jgi:3D (Asp-Asp-Asp) domain-containing protein
VVLIDAGTRREVTTSAATVGQMLAQEKAFPGREDRCSVRLSTPIHQDLVVTVTRVETRRRVERVALPFPVKVRFSTVLRSGTRIVKQAGRRGERVKTFAETYKDGRLVRTKKIAQTGTRPVPQVVVAGTRGLLASRGYFSGRRVLDMVATGYGPNCNGRWGARTASGLRPGYGVVAVDPRFIPLGTRVFVEGYGYAVAGDTGGAIKGNRIDLGFDSHRAAVLTGRKRVKVIILN